MDSLLALIGVLIVTALLVVGGLLLFDGFDWPNPEEENRQERIADSICQQFVAQRIRSTSAPEFGTATSTTIGDDRYWVRSSVRWTTDDSRRADYECRVRYDEDEDAWTLLALDLPDLSK